MRHLDAIIAAVGLLLGGIAYAYSNFATVQYVNTKHEGVLEILREMRSDIKEIKKDLKEGDY